MADIVTSRVFVDGEKGITAAKLNDIVASSVIQPAFYTSKPTASTVNPTDIALILQSGAYAQAQVSTLGGAATQAQIWSTRLRSFNAVGNPNFEVDQRSANTQLSNPSWICDRWSLGKVGTMSVLTQALANQPVPLPGTSFNISQGKMNLRLATAQASLGASDYLFAMQSVEGAQWRELSGDVTSISLLVYSDVALKFSVFIRSPDITRSLCKLVTVPAATWTVATLPNIPVPTGGNFTTAIGNSGYNIGICLAAGSTFTAPANDTWQNGNFMGAVGMDNWCSKPVNTNFTACMFQHEPGAVCSTFIDKPFSQNLDECQRYYQKSNPYSSAAGSSTTTYATFSSIVPVAGTAWVGYGGTRFPKPMAKNPTMTLYHATNATANQILVYYAASGTVPNASTSLAVTNATGTPSGIFQINCGTANSTAPMTGMAEYTADTGW